MGFRVFIVEDDEWYGEVLKYHLSLNPEFEVFLFESANECLSNLHLKPNAISIDFQLPDLNGEQLMEKIHAYNESIPVIIISGQKDITIALNLLKKGANDYLIKDDSTKDLLWNSLIKIQKSIELEEKVELLGIALYYYRYSTWKGKTIHLEDLIVKEQHRGKGIGFALYKTVIQQGKTDGVRRIEWAVLDWNSPAIEFYEKSGAKVFTDWRVAQMDENSIANFVAQHG